MSHVSKLSLRRRARSARVGSLFAVLLGFAALCSTPPAGSDDVPAPKERTPGVSGSQPPPYRDESRVVAVDAMVSVNRSKGGRWLHGDATPKEVATDALQVLVGDAARRVVAIEPAADKDQPMDEPWTLVLWFDSSFADSSSLRWAAEYLGQFAEQLTALGTVEVLLAGDTTLGGGVLADGARQVTPPTRDATELSDALSRMAVESPSGGDTLRRLRAEFLAVVAREPALTEDLAEHAIALEQALVQSRHDLLLSSLIGTGSHERGSGSPRRALFLVTDGWDTDPAAFYRHELESERDPLAEGVRSDNPALATDSARIDRATAVASRTLAAYGWLVFPLLAPPPPPPPPGFYIGKFFFHKPTLKPKKGSSAAPIPMLPGLAATRKKYLDPERARAYLSLGHALQGQGKIDDAIEAFEKAIFHFQNDKRTQKEQAGVWAALGEAFAQADRPVDTLRAFERVAQLDPSRAAQLGGVARILEPARPLTQLAETTSGFLVQDDQALRLALEDLRWRMRLTLELAGPPAGELLPLSITHRSGLRISAPAWARSATPPEITALRARRLLTEPLEASELGASWPVELTIQVDPTGTRVARVVLDANDLQLDDSGGAHAAGANRFLRATLVVRAGDASSLAPNTVIHGPVERWPAAAGPSEPGTWQWTFDLDAALANVTPNDEEGSPILAVIVDELDSGTWGGEVVALDWFG